MSRSILGCSCCGGGNAGWRLGWKTVEKPIGAKGLIADEREGDERVDGSDEVGSTLRGWALVVSLDIPETRLMRRRTAGVGE